MKYFPLLLILCLAGFVLTGCGDVVEQVIEQATEVVEGLEAEEQVSQEDLDDDKEPVMAQQPDFVKPIQDWLALSAEEVKEFIILFNENGIWPDDDFKFASSFGWVMHELENKSYRREDITFSNNHYLAIASILREIEEAFDDQFAYKDGKIFLEKNMIWSGDEFIPTIEMIISEIFIDPGDYFKPIEGGILKKYDVNPKDLFQQ